LEKLKRTTSFDGDLNRITPEYKYGTYLYAKLKEINDLENKDIGCRMVLK
jgi:hypothetical protein